MIVAHLRRSRRVVFVTAITTLVGAPRLVPAQNAAPRELPLKHAPQPTTPEITPADLMTRFFHLGDMLREYRGDSHVTAWVSAGFDATEIGLLTELYIRIPPRTYVRTRGWSEGA